MNNWSRTAYQNCHRFAVPCNSWCSIRPYSIHRMSNTASCYRSRIRDSRWQNLTPTVCHSLLSSAIFNSPCLTPQFNDSAIHGAQVTTVLHHATRSTTASGCLERRQALLVAEQSYIQVVSRHKQQQSGHNLCKFRSFTRNLRSRVVVTARNVEILFIL